MLSKKRALAYPLARRSYDSGVWRIAVWRISASRASKIVNARRSFMGRFSRLFNGLQIQWTKGLVLGPSKLSHSRLLPELAGVQAPRVLPPQWRRDGSPARAPAADPHPPLCDQERAETSFCRTADTHRRRSF